MDTPPYVTLRGRAPRPTPGLLGRIVLYGLGGALGVVVALVLSAGAASASTRSHPDATTYTLCASAGGAVTYVASGSCPGGSTKLNVPRQTEVTSLQGQVRTLTSEVSALESLLTGVTRATVNGYETLQISGENVQIVNGDGTEESENGLGNLILGYNDSAGVQSGSHNLVLGTGQAYTSYGGIVGGQWNTVTSPYAIVGGEYNRINDDSSSIVGGCDNITGSGVVPTGPCPSSGDEAIVGGLSNDATGVASTIGGGQSNTASGAVAGVSNGLSNLASATLAWIGGGYSNHASDNEAVITGGGHNSASGEVSTVVGGYYNQATNDEAVDVGGCSNIAGGGTVSVNSGCTDFGASFMSILGGIGNQADAMLSSISGGSGNVISNGEADAIAGGSAETLSLATNFLSRIGNTGFNP